MSEPTSFHDGRVLLHAGDCLAILRTLPDCSIDAVASDPPYHLVSIVRRFGAENAAPALSAAERRFAKTGGADRQPGTDQYGRLSRGFMGKTWDGGDIAFSVELWAEVFRVLKPGGHVVAFSGTRTYHRMTVAIEDAGFEVRDQLAWVYGQGFPKSHDVNKAIDKAAGAEREKVRVEASQVRNQKATGAGRDGMEGATRPWIEAALERGFHEKDGDIPATDAARKWQGWGTALKPAWEPICLARKPIAEASVAANVLAHGTGAINVDACRVETDDTITATRNVALGSSRSGVYGGADKPGVYEQKAGGRFPANIVHDGSPEVVQAFPAEAGAQRPVTGREASAPTDEIYGERGRVAGAFHGDSGSAARFFSSFPMEEDQCLLQKSASDAPQPLSLQSEAVVSALSDAVTRSTQRLALNFQDYRAQNIPVSESELRIACEAVTEAIQCIERRFLLGLRQESITVKLGHVTCAATQSPTGTTTITISLSTSDHYADHVTFSITETSADRGAPDFAAKRFHYSAKADADDRLGSKHPTVKPVSLMRWLVRLVTPPGGTVLDPFAGTGTTGHAALLEGFNAVLIEREEEYRADIARRMGLVFAGEVERAHAIVKARGEEEGHESLPLFGGAS